MSGSMQEFIGILDILDGIIVWKSGAYSVILQITPLNVGLQSEDQKAHIEAAFRTYLDSLRDPVQIYIRKIVHTMDEYLNYLRSKIDEETDETLLRFLHLYYDYIQGRGASREFFAQEFYLVIPFGGPTLGLTSAVGDWIGAATGTAKPKRAGGFGRDRAFEEARRQLGLRIQSAITVLSNAGLKATPLDTEEIVKLFYSIYRQEQYLIEQMSGTLDERMSIATLRS